LKDLDSKGELGIQKQFFKSAREFLETALKIMVKQLPAPESPLMKADYLLLQDQDDIDTPKDLGFNSKLLLVPLLI